MITGRAAWNSEAPDAFREIASTPSYVLWEKRRDPPLERHVLLEGTEPAAFADCAAPEIAILTSNPGRASLFPEVVIGQKRDWVQESTLGTGESATQALDLPRGRWLLSLQYFSPFDLTLSGPGFRQPLEAALDGQRPNTISLANNGQFWPAGEYRSDGGPAEFTISADEPTGIQSLTGYDGKAAIGELVAVRDQPHRIVDFGEACGHWLDWYQSGAAP